MSAAAKGFWAGNGNADVSSEKALAVLDAAAEDFIGADAEFDDALSEESPLSKLVAIAFEASADEIADLRGEYECEDGDSGLLWYEGPQSRFSERYKFC